MEQQPLFHPNYAQENQFSLKEKKNTISSHIILIICQILVWGFLIYTLIYHDFYPILIITYILYIIIELCSHTSFFLLNKKSTNSIYNKLKELFSSPPVLQLSVSCYHYEKRLEQKKNKEGQNVEVEVQERVETYKERREFPFYSFRDISGLFKVDLDNEIYRNKTYIKLTLDTVISFADSISYYDYQIFKNNFIDGNKLRDENIDFHENFYISNLSRNNLIRIKDEEPFYVNYFFFFLCTIFTMALPYEIMLDNISIEGKYQIKKIISTRYNLNTYEYDGMYGYSIPSIKLGSDTYNFTSDDYGYFDQNAEINLPTLDEIENAKQYEEQIKKPIFDDHSLDETNNNNLDLPTQEEINFQNDRRKYD
jgi:hypothetical protein